ncbi:MULTISPECIES: helix-turn-helix domain-containing protein [Flagellimonas]|uniref:AraC family transcriptional regulator n=1 Tax=Flagellimonas hadalis TaxID=2597517 RepID=A0A5N5IXI3_9FLAO|nr:helix-turn-helix domain-containing protein [Allomuricauda hadalis]KAB5489480.1 AraC family transcriptional regulator [Allomuricauda hadalis]RUA10907.1 MAG: hypothetical protein DSY83_17320 [Flavobacteriia bacterium]
MKRLLHQIKMKYLGEQDKNIIAQHGQRKYEKSGLTKEQALKIRAMITKAFDEDKIYRNNDMGLDDLAEHIKHNRYKVSQVINTYFSKNFYTYLSEYRVKEAKRLLASNPSLSVKAIMYEVGFNSKNSFYTAFKKSTGISPNGYRNAFYKQEVYMA